MTKPYFGDTMKIPMQIKHEIRYYGKNEKVWVGKYRNSQNLTHWHTDCELVCAERGAFEIMCDKSVYRLECGQAFFIDSEQLHFIRAEQPDNILITIFFTYDIIKPFAGRRLLASPLLECGHGVEALYSSLKADLLEGNDLYEADTALTVAKFVLNILRNGETVARAKPKQTTERFKQLLDVMSENYEFFSFESAADFMGMNAAYFSRFFHNTAGVPFSRYLNYIRISKAVSMLNSGESAAITEIASKCGFSTIRNFNRVFKAVTGFSPKNIPRDYVIDEAFLSRNSHEGNPTLTECELVECSSMPPRS